VSPEAVSDQAEAPAAAGTVSETLGSRIRHQREAAGLTVRGLAGRIGVSASLISQVERGRATPSVATLWAIAHELAVPVGDLFADSDQLQRGRGNEAGPVQLHDTRRVLTLEGGVRWERLTPDADDSVDFVYVVYPAGTESCRKDALARHGGKEYGYVISGTLGVQIGFDEYEVGPNCSISFNAAVPHRLSAIGDEPVVAVWIVLNRTNDARVESGS
jgi:transcriptional regulator with XRE-family HTH domain